MSIVSVDRLKKDQIVVGLSDGRAMSFSLEKLLQLTPDKVVTVEDLQRSDLYFRP